ncbi:hypothetical protein TNCT_312811 [Trichonephila clavata]|uniref:Uncharacterized protein n=1 Tax=Trichonephila clavata TaxID=2740835 RepID=A0A8X6FS71_TRICU|nr:hypothetical protein TNCT_312811 [Trichonephila clavata]
MLITSRKSLLLTEKIERKRPDWRNKHVLGTRANWVKIMFAGETKFYLHRSDRSGLFGGEEVKNIIQTCKYQILNEPNDPEKLI